MFSQKSRNPRLYQLKDVILFKDLTIKELDVLDSLMHERRYLAGEVVCDEGEEGQALFVVLSGRIETRRKSNPDHVRIEFGAGSFFGEIALLDQSPRTVQLVALEDSLIVALFREEFISILQTHSTIASRISYQLARALATRLRMAILQSGPPK